jgi:guanylate kinase
MDQQNLGNLYIVAAPSGGGKTSLVKKLVGDLDNLVISISHTTRKKRPGEQEGIDYFFVNEEAFLQLIHENAFIEHAQVFDHYYGTSISQIQSRLAAGVDVVLDIDWQGAQQIRTLFPESLSIFIIPPSLEALTQRLQNRGRDDEETIAHRMCRAKAEMQHYAEFDYLIVNDDFLLAAQQLEAIVVANRLRTVKQVINQAKLLSFLLS